uniref:CDC20/Fizzy WD40 domain-containing protein n=1 Tax=Strigamia maritima TaxID=126957 RepID=T1J1K2_STRMM
MPNRILDAPEIVDDYYLNLLDWSVNNHLALSLADTVYLWNSVSGEIQQVMTMDNSTVYISSVSWVREGSHLAIGTSLGEVQIWDVAEHRRIRNMTGHQARVGWLSWNSYIVSSGCRTGAIHHHDVRVPQHQVGSSRNHTQEVCGLRWSPDGCYLASVGNDNLLNVWPVQSGEFTPTINRYLHLHSIKRRLK